MFYDNQCVLKYVSYGNLSAEERAWVDVTVACLLCQSSRDSVDDYFVGVKRFEIFNAVCHLLDLNDY